jgi:error-prone DNA polymerase
VGWNNPDVPWSELEGALSGRVPRSTGPLDAEPDGGDGPAWSRKREPYDPPPRAPRPDPATTVPFAELHCHSNFSFLDGASHP